MMESGVQRHLHSQSRSWVSGQLKGTPGGKGIPALPKVRIPALGSGSPESFGREEQCLFHHSAYS